MVAIKARRGSWCGVWGRSIFYPPKLGVVVFKMAQLGALSHTILSSTRSSFSLAKWTRCYLRVHHVRFLHVHPIAHNLPNTATKDEKSATAGSRLTTRYLIIAIAIGSGTSAPVACSPCYHMRSEASSTSEYDGLLSSSQLA